nr:MFS transporter [Acidipropionibacterium acidipropionici]
MLVAAAHLAAFVLTLFLSRAETPASTSDGSAERTSVREDLRAGIGYVLRTRWLLWTLIFGSANALIIQGPIEVLLPFITRQHFADPEATYGFLMAGYGVGGAVGSLIVSAMRLPGRYLTFMLACWGGGTLPLVVIGAAEHQAPMLVALFVAGAATSGGVVIWGTLLQRLVPPEMIGRVASLDFFVSIAFMPVSIAIAGPLSLVIPVDVIFLLAGLLPPVFALVAMVAGRMNATQVANPLDVGSEGGRTREG